MSHKQLERWHRPLLHPWQSQCIQTLEHSTHVGSSPSSTPQEPTAASSNLVQSLLWHPDSALLPSSLEGCRGVLLAHGAQLLVQPPRGVDGGM